jgi:hypothetical protein
VCIQRCISMASTECFLAACFHLIATYVKIRVIIRDARHSKKSTAATTARLMRGNTLSGVREIHVLRALNKKLKSKGRRQKWGNVLKSWDCVGRQLLQMKLIRQTSRNRWCQESLTSFLWQSFKARLICHTSDRLLRGTLPLQPVPPQEQRWSIYGLTSKVRSFKSGMDVCSKQKHTMWLAAYNRGESLGFSITPKRRLSVKDITRLAVGVGAFSALQILTDVVMAGGRRLVDLPCEFGPGVHLGRKLSCDDLMYLVDRFNRSGRLRNCLGCRISMIEMAHLVCEVRQWTCGQQHNIETFVMCKVADIQPIAAGEKKHLCEDIAAYACE